MERESEFEALFDETFTRCVAVARRITGDRLVAEDLAAESFARAWARWPKLVRDEHRGGWVSA